jgi:hypothetical protein
MWRRWCHGLIGSVQGRECNQRASILFEQIQFWGFTLDKLSGGYTGNYKVASHANSIASHIWEIDVVGPEFMIVIDLSCHVGFFFQENRYCWLVAWRYRVWLCEMWIADTHPSHLRREEDRQRWRRKGGRRDVGRKKGYVGHFVGGWRMK